MRKSNFNLLFLFLIFILSCESFNDKPDKSGYWEPADPLIIEGTSSVYPYGLTIRKHANSVSVNNTPPFSTTITAAIGNNGLNNDIKKVARPDYANPDTYKNIIYFDSDAADNGDGTFENPYNSMEGLTNGSLLEEHTAYLFKAGSVFMSSGIRQDFNQMRSTMYFGSYGEGDMPIICTANKFENPDETKGSFWFYGDHIAIDGLHLVRCNYTTYTEILLVSGSDIMIANCHIEGIRDSNGIYPNFGIKDGVKNLTIYNTEFAFVGADLFLLSNGYSGYNFVSNFFHHCNMRSFSGDAYDPQDKDTWLYKNGDIIQFEGGTPKHSYFANNVFDRGDSPSKFCFIINGATPLNDIAGTTIEYNTFINPVASVNGGACCYIYSHVIFKDNLFINTDPDGGVSGLATHPGFGQDFTNNHFVNYNGSEFYGITLDKLGEGNLIFNDLDTYHSEVSLQERKGSSLF